MPEDAAEEYKTNSFFAHIGYAITRWAFIDRDLFQFCHWALATTEAKTAVVFYGSAQIGVHISLTDTLMKQSVSGRDLKEWQAIKLELDRLLPLRNDLAHEPVQQIVHFDTFTRSPGMIVFTASPSAKVTWESRTEERKFLRKWRRRKNSL